MTTLPWTNRTSTARNLAEELDRLDNNLDYFQVPENLAIMKENKIHLKKWLKTLKEIATGLIKVSIFL